MGDGQCKLGGDAGSGLYHLCPQLVAFAGVSIKLFFPWFVREVGVCLVTPNGLVEFTAGFSLGRLLAFDVIVRGIYRLKALYSAWLFLLHFYTHARMYTHTHTHIHLSLIHI